MDRKEKSRGTFTAHYDDLPQWLKENGKFCLWKLKQGNGEITKPPVSIRDGKISNAFAPESSGSFTEALAALKRFKHTGVKGLGYPVPQGITAIDIDGCIQDGVLHPFAETILDRVQSFSEISQSGRGVHILCKTADIKPIKDYSAKYNQKISIDGMSFEIYPGGNTNRYLAVTGNRLSRLEVFDGLFPDFEIEERSQEIADILDEYMRKTPSSSTEESKTVEMKTETPPVNDRPTMTDEELLNHAGGGKNGELFKALYSGDWESITDESGYRKYESRSSADLALCSLLAFYTGDSAQIDRLFRGSNLFREKWDSKRGASTYGQNTIRLSLAGIKNVWSPNYGQDDIDSLLDLLIQSPNESAQAVLTFLKEHDVMNNPRYAANDIGNGNLLADFCESFARCIDGKVWMTYDGLCWSEDRGNVAILEVAKNISSGFALLAAENLSLEDRGKLLKRANAWTQQRCLNTAITMAASVHPVKREMFDTDKYALNCLNGTIDLRTGELRPHDPEDFTTKLAQVNFNPDATCDRWIRFTREIMVPGESEITDDEESEDGAITQSLESITKEKVHFLQKYLGYCLSGVTKEETFLVCYGPTSRNGKSVLTETLHGLLGNYAKSVQPETLLQTNNRNGSSPSEDVARLSGARFVSVGEIPQGGRLDAARMKLLTGNDTITARYLGQNSFEFRAEFKLLLHTNHLPKVSDMSIFESGRVLILPFSRHFEPREQDKGLKEFFQTAEIRSGILNWLLEGFRMYQREGLSAPGVMRRAVQQYRDDSDKIKRFTEDCLMKKPGAKAKFTGVYERYRAWCAESGNLYESSGVFKTELSQRGVRVDRGRIGSSAPTTRVNDYVLRADVA